MVHGTSNFHFWPFFEVKTHDKHVDRLKMRGEISMACLDTQLRVANSDN